MSQNNIAKKLMKVMFRVNQLLYREEGDVEHTIENIEKLLDSIIFYAENGKVHHCPNCEAKINKKQKTCKYCNYSLKYIRELEEKYKKM